MANKKSNPKKDFIISCLQAKKHEYSSIPWAKEMKIMNALWEKCQDDKFWEHSKPDFKIPSLAWFLSDAGRKYLNERYKRFKSNIIPEKEKIELKNDIQEENICFSNQKKIKTLKDFINKK